MHETLRLGSRANLGYFMDKMRQLESDILAQYG